MSKNSSPQFLDTIIVKLNEAINAVEEANADLARSKIINHEFHGGDLNNALGLMACVLAKIQYDNEHQHAHIKIYIIKKLLYRSFFIRISNINSFVELYVSRKLSEHCKRNNNIQLLNLIRILF